MDASACRVFTFEPAQVIIEKLSEAFIQAINERNFDANRYPWTRLSDKHSKLQSRDSPKPRKKHEYLAMWRKFTLENPDCNCYITEMFTTVHENIDFAECYINADTTGVYDNAESDIVKKAVIKAVFQRYEGEWALLTTCVIDGMGGVL